LDLVRLRVLLKKPVFIDLRNVFLIPQMKEAGFTYVSIGRPECIPMPERKHKAI
jgi:UDPglucose 6-dehydrogenase